jgi:hypothetical protein
MGAISLTQEICMSNLAALRQTEIGVELATRGLAMESSLSSLDGDVGHALIELSSGEPIDPPNQNVLALATEWSRLKGVVDETLH